MFKDSKTFSSFSVDALEEAKAFYHDLLGIEVQESEEGLELHLANTNMVFIYKKEDHTPATFTVLNFLVDDIDKSVDELVAKGVTFEHYSGDMETDVKGVLRGLEAGRGPNIAWFKDPAGNFLSIIQNK